MKYENKKKVDVLCAQINSLNKLSNSIEDSKSVVFRSEAGYNELVLELDANKEDEDVSFLSSQVKHFQSNIIELIEAESNRLRKELEKL